MDSAEDPVARQERALHEAREGARAAARLFRLQRDEAYATIAAVRQELTTALEEHRAHESQLAEGR